MSSQATEAASPATRKVVKVTAVFAFLAVVMGSLVCATESGAACPTWPGCYVDQFGPKPVLNPIIEFTHRVIASTYFLLVTASAVMCTRAKRPLIKWLPWLAWLGAVLAAVFGMMIVLFSLPKTLGTLDLFGSLASMVCMIVVAVALEKPLQRNRTTDTAWGTAGLVTLMHLLGIAVASPGSYTRCMGWPIWRLIETDFLPGVQVLRLVLAGLAIVGVLLLGRRLKLQGLMMAVAGVLVVEQALGFVLSAQGWSLGLAAVYSSLAVGFLALLAWLAAREGVAAGKSA